MNQKTSQLQIRVSPEEKALLKRLAASADMSVSAYVLDAALPSASTELRQHLAALKDRQGRHKTLSDLSLELSRLPSSKFDAATSALDVHELPPLQQNLAAAAFEQETMVRRGVPPTWALEVPALTQPTFGPDLASLRPYLLCSSPAALKRRNVFMQWDDRPVGGQTTEAQIAGRTPFRPESENEERLARLDGALEARGVVAEVCLVGGAIMPFVFRAAPESRRPRELFALDQELLEAATETEPGLEPGWVNEAARAIVRVSHASFYAGSSLTVLEPPADYVLAMKCLTLAWAPSEPQAAERDISYLLRFLGLNRPRTALERITAYLNSRQIPADLETRLPALI